MFNLFEDFPLSGSELRNWLRTSGQAIFTEFGSGSAALTFAREFGMKIRDADFFAIRREVLNMAKFSEAVRGVGDESLIPLAYTVTNHGWNLSDNFLYRMKVFGTDPETRASVEKFFAISSSRQLTAGQAKDILGSMLGGEEDFYGIAVEGMELDAAMARPDLW